MKRVIGYLNRPTTDGRMIGSIRFDEVTPVLAQAEPWSRRGPFTLVGTAHSFRLDGDEITCESDHPLADAQCLTMQLDDVEVDLASDVMTMTGRLAALVVSPAAEWPWSP